MLQNVGSARPEPGSRLHTEDTRARIPQNMTLLYDYPHFHISYWLLRTTIHLLERPLLSCFLPPAMRGQKMSLLECEDATVLSHQGSKFFSTNECGVEKSLSIFTIISYYTLSVIHKITKCHCYEALGTRKKTDCTGFINRLIKKIIA